MRNPIRRILFITPLILAEFHNAGQIFLFGNLGNVTQSKKRKFCFSAKISEVLHKFPKKEICDTGENSPPVSVKIVQISYKYIFFLNFYLILNTYFFINVYYNKSYFYIIFINSFIKKLIILKFLIFNLKILL